MMSEMWRDDFSVFKFFTARVRSKTFLRKTKAVSSNWVCFISGSWMGQAN
jgi:hypothetical protein